MFRPEPTLFQKTGSAKTTGSTTLIESHTELDSGQPERNGGRVRGPHELQGNLHSEHSYVRTAL